MADNLSYWLAIDESLNSNRFRCIEHSHLGETFYETPYGTVSYRSDFPYYTATVKAKGRESISVVYPGTEQPDEQELLSLLVFWHAKPLFLAVPDIQSDNEPEQHKQETLF